MIATLLVGGVLNAAADAFVSITQSLVDLKTLRGMKKEAEGDLKVVKETVVLTSAELEALSQNPVWMQGRLRAEVSKRHGGL